MTRFISKLFLVGLLIIGVAWAFGLVSLQQTRDAQLPRLSLVGGQTPKFVGDVARVDIGSRTEAVTVPVVAVGTAERAIEVPTVHVTKPADKAAAPAR